MENRSRVAVDYSNIVGNLLTLGVVVVDRRFNVVLWNRFMELNSGLRAESVLGRNLFETFPELNRNWLEKKIKSCLILKTASFSSWKQRPYLFRFKPSLVLSGESEYMYQDASIFPVYDSSGIVEGGCIVIHDTTELAEATRLLDRTLDQTLDLEELNQRDGLTGLYNRKFFDEQITQEILSARRYNWQLALAMIDIDNFKDVNDTYGHMAGDIVLHGLAARLQAMLRSSDTLCRYGGEEFALILPQINPDNARGLMERLRKAVQGTEITGEDGRRFKITISIGIANLSEGLSGGQLLARADESLYKSKRGGRNRVTSYADVGEMGEADVDALA